MSIVFASLKYPKLPISAKIPVALLRIVYICMTPISPNLNLRTTSLLTWQLRGCNLHLKYNMQGHTCPVVTFLVYS